MNLIWRQQAACQGLDPEIFYPPTDEDSAPAKVVCAQCAVKPACLEHALGSRERDGVWGGATEKERRRIIRQRRRFGLTNRLGAALGPRLRSPPVGATLEDLGGWVAVLGPLTQGVDIPADATKAAMAEILGGNATSAQIAAFIVALRMKGESIDELVGLLDAMAEAGEKVVLPSLDGVVDIVGTGGDRSHSVNVSTMSAIVAAGAGARVCKHGNRAASSRCGAADLLEALGVKLELEPEDVARCVAEAGIGFCYAPRFHPAMRHAGPTRKELGVPTVFNVLGPMSNPAGVRRQLLGVADPSKSEIMARVLEARGSERVLIVHGDDGLDELTTTTTSTIVELVDGRVRTSTVDPTELGFALVEAGALLGGDAAHNADVTRRVFAGEAGAARDVVLLNAGAALVAAGVADDLPAGVAAAAESILSGSAAAALDRLVASSNA